MYGLRHGNLAAGPLVQAITSLDTNGMWEDTRVLVSSLHNARHISVSGPDPGWISPVYKELHAALQGSRNTLRELQLRSPIYGPEILQLLAQLPHLATLQLSKVVVSYAADASTVQQLAAACPWRNLTLHGPVSPAALCSLPLGSLQSLQISGLPTSYS